MFRWKVKVCLDNHGRTGVVIVTRKRFCVSCWEGLEVARVSLSSDDAEIQLAEARAKAASATKSLKNMKTLLTLLALLMLASPAAAATGWKPTAARGPILSEQQKLDLVLPAARTRFALSPCSGAEQIELGADAQINRVFSPGTVIGMHEAGTCRVFILGGLDTYGFCWSTLHELGHAAGLSHDKTWLMAVNQPQGYHGVCERLSRPYRVRDAWRRVMVSLPAQGRGWRSSRVDRHTARLRRQGWCDRIVRVDAKEYPIEEVEIGRCR